MNRMPVAAIMYDFDRTLCTKDMQDYSFIPRLNMTEDEFWKFSNELGQSEHMDSILAYMYAMVKKSREICLFCEMTLLKWEKMLSSLTA